MENFNPQAQMSLIEEMIQAKRKEMNENGFMYLLWGWLVFIASLGEYILIKLQFPYPFVTWFLMVVGGIVSIFAMKKENKERVVKTWIDRMMKFIWIAFGICLFIVLASQSMLQVNTFPMVLLVYGIGTFLSGGALSFKPLIWGGLFCWILSALAFFVDFDLQLLLLAACVMGAYIIPGYLLKSRFKNA